MEEKPQFIWDIGTAYDLFTSLDVLHHPDRYGLRGNWAAGVRSRLPAKKRELLQKVTKKGYIWALPWVAHLSLEKKDAATVLKVLREIPAAERLKALSGCYLKPLQKEILYDVLERGSWNDGDLENLREVYKELYRTEGKKKKVVEDDLIGRLDMWANAEQFAEDYLEALQTYYDVFFKEDEQRIRTALEETMVRAQKLTEELSLLELIEELSQGLQFDEEDLKEIAVVRMVPSFWTTPLSLFAHLSESREGEWLFLFGGRPADVSLVPGEVVPELLYQTLKALADPTRLRILRYLSAEPLTPAELARRLRLRPPTVIHHLDSLRLARLVQLRLGQDGRRYGARREAVKQACEMLESYLDGG